MTKYTVYWYKDGRKGSLTMNATEKEAIDGAKKVGALYKVDGIAVYTSGRMIGDWSRKNGRWIANYGEKSVKAKNGKDKDWHPFGL